jgi:hypothetical protein
MKKIIDLPVIYEADVIPVGCRKNRTVNMIDYHPFEIEDLSDNNPGIIGTINQKNIQVIRKHENILLKPLVFSGLPRIFSSFSIFDDEKDFHNSFNQIGLNRISLDDFYGNILKSEHNDKEDVTHYNINFLANNFSFLVESCRSYHTIPCIKFQNIKTLLSDNKNKVIQKIQKKINEYYLINNVFFERFNETSYRMRVDPISFNYLSIVLGYGQQKENQILKYNSMMDSSFLYLPLSMVEILNKKEAFNNNIINIFKPKEFINANENFLANNLIGLLNSNLKDLYSYGIDRKWKTRNRENGETYLSMNIHKLDHSYSLLKKKHEHDILTFQDVVDFSLFIKEHYIDLKSHFLHDFHTVVNFTYDIDYLEKADEYINKIIDKFQIYLLNIDMQDTVEHVKGIKS